MCVAVASSRSNSLASDGGINTLLQDHVFAAVVLCSGVQLVVFWATTMAFCAVGFFFQLSVNWVYLLPSFFFGILVFGPALDWNVRRLFATSILSAVSIVGSCIFAAQFIDWSCDGNMYHKIAVVAMADGWNPLLGSVAEWPTFLEAYPSGSQASLWVDHYAHGVWEFSACFYSLTHNLEASKGYTVLAMIALGFLLTGLLRIKGLKRWQAIAVGSIAAANPIALAQCSTFYCDGFLALNIGVLLVGLIIVADGNLLQFRKAALFLVVGAFIACAETKFTGLAFAGVYALAFAFLYIIFGVRKKKGFRVCDLVCLGMTLVGAVLLSTLVVGFSPYVTNYLSGGHPFYPLFGDGAIDIMTSNAPSWITGASNNLEKIIISLFSPVSSPHVGYEPIMPELKIPFTWDQLELNRLSLCDPRMGGFGVLFSGIFLACIPIAAGVLLSPMRRTSLLTSCFLTYFVVTVGLMLGLSDSWWARYSGYAYYSFCFLLVFLFAGSNPKRGGKYSSAFRLAGVIVSALLLLNALFFVKYNVVHHFDESREWCEVLDEWADRKYEDGKELHVGALESQPALIYTLKDLGIEFIYEGLNPDGFDPNDRIQYLVYKIE